VELSALERSPVVRPLDSLPAFHGTRRSTCPFSTQMHKLKQYAVAKARGYEPEDSRALTGRQQLTTFIEVVKKRSKNENRLRNVLHMLCVSVLSHDRFACEEAKTKR
jgi:hypothetical protein